MWSMNWDVSSINQVITHYHSNTSFIMFDYYLKGFLLGMLCVYCSSEKAWSKEDKAREKQLMSDLVTIIEQRNQIINSLDQDRQRWANYISGPVSIMTGLIQSMCSQTNLFVCQVLSWRSPFTGDGTSAMFATAISQLLRHAVYFFYTLGCWFDIVESHFSGLHLCNLSL